MTRAFSASPPLNNRRVAEPAIHAQHAGMHETFESVYAV